MQEDRKPISPVYSASSADNDPGAQTGLLGPQPQIGVLREVLYDTQLSNRYGQDYHH